MRAICNYEEAFYNLLPLFSSCDSTDVPLNLEYIRVKIGNQYKTHITIAPNYARSMTC
jgi:hypothetical protein